MADSLRRWASRGSAADAVLAAVVGVVVVVLTVLPVFAQDNHVAPGPLDWVLMIAGSAALYFRRRFPVAVAVAAMLLTAAFYALGEAQGPMLLTFAIALYTAAAEGHLTAAMILAVVTMLAATVGEIQVGFRHLDGAALFLFVGWLSAVIGIGRAIYNRNAFRREAEQRARAAERTKEEEIRLRATEERLRIAREVHDLLGHHLSLINVQASAALHRRGDQEATDRALDAIKLTSKEALRDLRATLGVLRQVDEAAPTAPAPGMDRLGELVELARTGGLVVHTEVSGDVRPVPADADLAAYRIVQEGLTNVTRHAAAATATVSVSYGEHELGVEILDDGNGAPAAGTGDGTGTGIRGMRERVRALGGELTVGDRPEGGFRVHAVLPLRDPA